MNYYGATFPWPDALGGEIHFGTYANDKTEAESLLGDAIMGYFHEAIPFQLHVATSNREPA